MFPTITEINICLLGNGELKQKELLQILDQAWGQGIIVDTLVLTPAQLHTILQWDIPEKDITKPINYDLARIKVRVSPLPPQKRH